MPLSDPDLRARIARDPWTAQNIRLSDAVTTLPDKPDFFQFETRLHALTATLEMVFGSDLTGRRIVDLGCLEGGVAFALARLGATAVGVDARARNIAKSQLLKEHFGLANLDYVVRDVKEFTRERDGEWDVVLAMGILYHLDEPVTWLRQIAEATRGLLFLDTHVAPPDKATLKQLLQNGPRLGGLEERTV